MTEGSRRAPSPYAPPVADGDRVVAFTGERDPDMPGVVRYRYVPRLIPMVLAVSFFGAASIFYVWRAQGNDRGLVINGLIELGTAGATRFYVALAAASAGFVAIGSWALAVRLGGPKYLVLGERALSIPSRFGRGAKVFEYSAIQDVQLVKIQGQSSLQLVSAQGKAAISGMMLASDAQLREIGAALAERLGQRR